MAVHTVPQDVETDDKILGPFNIRQFIYLIIVAALIGVGYLLAQIFIGLIVIVIPPAIFLLILALPIKKDQPMETYLAAKISFLFKNNKRLWMPGQSETTIEIAAPKKVEEERTKGFSQAEAMRRLSFLADIVDTEGYAIKGNNPNLPFNEEVYAEADSIVDIYDTEKSTSLNNTLDSNNTSRHQALVEQMRNAIDNTHNLQAQNASISHGAPEQAPVASFAPNSAQSPVPAPAKTKNEPILPTTTFSRVPQLPSAPDYYDTQQEKFNPVNIPAATPIAEQNTPQDAPIAAQPAPAVTNNASPDMINLANNENLSVETIAKEANRISQKQNNSNDGEVYISLH